MSGETACILGLCDGTEFPDCRGHQHERPPGRSGFRPRPFEAVEDFLRENRQFAIDREIEKFHITFNPNGYLRRTGPSGKQGGRTALFSAPQPSKKIFAWLPERGYRNSDFDAQRQSRMERLAEVPLCIFHFALTILHSSPPRAWRDDAECKVRSGQCKVQNACGDFRYTFLEGVPEVTEGQRPAASQPRAKRVPERRPGLACLRTVGARSKYAPKCRAGSSPRGRAGSKKKCG